MPDKSNGKVRIIGGLWKRTPIPVLNAKGLRPTGDRQRETLFNWLEFLCGGLQGLNALDMFGGSGALSLEFLSRGGRDCVLFETNRAAARAVTGIAEKLSAQNLSVLPTNSLCSPLLGERGPYDVVFIDPPFAENLQLHALRVCLPHLSPQGLVYVESPEEIKEDTLSEYALKAVRRAKSGASYMLLAQKKDAEV